MTGWFNDILKGIVTALVVLVVSGTAWCDSVTIEEEARVGCDIVKLSDVATLRGKAALELVDLEITRFKNTQTSIVVTMDQIRDQLTEHGVHWGTLTCRGSQKIKIDRIDRSTIQPATVASNHITTTPQHSDTHPATTISPASAPTSSPSSPTYTASTRHGTTLQQCLTNWITTKVGVSSDRIKINQHDSRKPTWQISSMHGRFVFSTTKPTLLGRIPVKVRQYREDTLIGTWHVTVTVQMLHSVIVTADTLRRGHTIVSTDIETKQQWLDRSLAGSVTDSAQVIGMVMHRTVRKGNVLNHDDIVMAKVVNRGQVVIVRCVSGSLVFKTQGRAKEDGHIGQLIQVHDERTKQTYTARVSGPGETMMIVNHPERIESNYSRPRTHNNNNDINRKQAAG